SCASGIEKRPVVIGFSRFLRFSLTEKSQGPIFPFPARVVLSKGSFFRREPSASKGAGGLRNALTEPAVIRYTERSVARRMFLSVRAGGTARSFGRKGPGIRFLEN